MINPGAQTQSSGEVAGIFKVTWLTLAQGVHWLSESIGLSPGSNVPFGQAAKIAKVALNLKVNILPTLFPKINDYERKFGTKSFKPGQGPWVRQRRHFWKQLCDANKSRKKIWFTLAKSFETRAVVTSGTETRVMSSGCSTSTGCQFVATVHNFFATIFWRAQPVTIAWKIYRHVASSFQIYGMIFLSDLFSLLYFFSRKKGNKSSKRNEDWEEWCENIRKLKISWLEWKTCKEEKSEKIVELGFFLDVPRCNARLAKASNSANESRR